MSLAWWRYPTRRFSIDGLDFAVSTVARLDGIHCTLKMLGSEVGHDRLPIAGPEATRNFHLVATLPDGRVLDIDAGYIGWWTIGIIARLNGVIIHESHPGQTPQFPENLKSHVNIDWREQGAFAKRNRIPLAVDVATSLLFFVVAKLTDLTTAALVGAAVGIALVVFQRITRIDVTGGLALFGIVMLCISAAFALAFQDNEIIKLRSTIVGSIAAFLFLCDGMFGGKRLASGIVRYMPYDDIDPGRLGIGIGLTGLVMAALNYAVAKLASTDVWLFYTTFADTAVSILLTLAALRYARGGNVDPPKQQA
jgi:intracellular septation protein A